MSKALLEVKSLSKSFGGVKAVDGFDMTLREGQFAGLIGPNGAGKTTVFNLVSGTVQPTAGHIRLNGKPLEGRKPEAFAAEGIARTFQNIRLFKQLTVFENVLAGLHSRADRGLWPALARPASFREKEQELQETALELLRTFGLEDRADDLAVHLSYGDQRRLEIVRALATRPSVLLLDEPAAGMNPAEGQKLVELLAQVREAYGLTFVLIEHDMEVVMELCDHIYVLDYGRKIFEGSPLEVRHSKAVREAYLGVDD